MCSNCPYVESSSEVSYRRKKEEAKKYAIENEKTVVLYKNENGVFFSEQESYFSNPQGQFIEFVSQVNTNSTS